MKRTKPKLWKKIVAKVKKGSKYGKPDSWNARKAQYAVKLYKKAGGRYKGKKSPKNKLAKWTRQDWQYSSKKQKRKGRYLPKKVWQKLTAREKTATNRKKRKATKQHKKKAKYSNKIAKLVKEA